MCGILGVFRSQNNISENELHKATSTISHRGPDASGIVFGSVDRINYALSHTRLSIIDLSEHANQPFTGINNNYCIVFNGEIYNYRALKQQLQEKGYRFKTNSDTEVLLVGYEEWGANILSKLDGMFAFIIVDKINQNVFFARDHFGIKPLYYYLSKDNDLYLGSEIKSFFEFRDVTKKVNTEFIGEYLANLWVGEPDTLFKDIFKVPAGFYGYYSREGLELKKYWDLPTQQNMECKRNEKEIIDHVSYLIQKASIDQLVSDVPVGVYVSGGIDSSAILDTVANNTNKKVIGLIAGFKEEDQKYEGTTSDLFSARKLIKQYSNIEAHEIIMEPEIIQYYKKLMWHMDEPIADPAIIPSYLLAKRSRELGSIVMLSGMGGDEVFCGYNRFALIDKAMNMPGILGFILQNVLKTTQWLPLSGKTKKTVRDINRAAQYIQRPDSIGYQGLLGYFDSITISKMIGSDHWVEKYKFKYEFASRPDLDMFKRFMYNDFKGFLASHNLIYSDKSSMAAGIEARVPLLNKELVEFAWGLDSKFLLKDGLSKYPLKKMLENKISKELVYRKKAGFSLPIRSWINKDIKQEILDRLNDKNSPMYVYIDYSVVQNIIQSHFKKNLDRTMEIWILYTLHLWFEIFEM